MKVDIVKSRRLTLLCRSFATSVVLVVAAFLVAAHAQETTTNNWHPDTRLLDLNVPHDPVMGDAGSTLARDVKAFYQFLHDKQWRKTYELRAKAFREDCPESDYLAQAKQRGTSWGLVNYDVLSIGFRGSPGATKTDEAVLICKFTELPESAVCYSTGLSAGPSKLSIFRSLRPPIIDWR